jgi:GH24 family phage-related lysozyme (muramidase)
MICQTVKIGTECSFMTKKGCGFIGGQCKAAIDKCEGCSRIFEWESGKYCKIYADPAGRWVIGVCPSATHLKVEMKESTQKINPLKASKRASRAKKK